MKKNVRARVCSLVLCLMLAVLAGCSPSGREFAPTGNGMYISKEGMLSTAFVVSVDQSYYTEADMRAFCEAEVKEYNRSKGASAVAYQEEAAEEETLPVAIQSLTFGSQAQLILNYATPEDYLAFNEKDETTAKSVIYAAAKNTTGLPDISLVSVKDGTKIAAGSIIGDGKLMILMVEGEQNVQVDGKLVYYSENVTPTGEDTAVTAAEGHSYLVFK
ncbi:MAG: hypothetical protein HFI39_09720 [Lachnospiraceae bacterium]|nr:hypothetical protein [Lachnospiraceae bacterium]